jgi:hypothetical protein
MQEYNEIQSHIDDLTGTKQQERHKAQRELMKKLLAGENDQRQEVQQVQRATPSYWPGENRAQRRERERQERRAEKKVKA